jgi:diguanylate cyclase (GGDEF)-like protein
MSVRMGSGIAGKVAASGTPFLVNDIEVDERIAALNRPRFKTKSFISVPLLFKGEPLGVLNLSDKKNHGIFTKADLNILTPFVNHAAAMIKRAGSLERVELLEQLSITDALTELYNRRFLEKRMEEELNRSERNGLPLTVMLIDLDNFKIYNDVCGHIAGDRALKKAAQVLRNSVREMDVVTRYGGEEFCVLLPGTTKREAIFVAERVRRGIESELFSGEEHLPQGRLTTSIGLSSFPEDGFTATDLINASDVALYQAKAEGRNCIMLSNGGKDVETTRFSGQAGLGIG